MSFPTQDRHLWLALSPHGYGHAAMTAPLVAELRRRHPGMRLTIQTALPRDFLASRYGADFELVDTIPDFGLCMTSAVGVDPEASAAAYAGLVARWPELVAEEAARLAEARPGLVLANVPPVTLAAAAAAGIPAVAFSSLNWHDLYAHYCGERPEAAGILARLRKAYRSAAVFLRTTPAMDMSLPNRRDVGPVAAAGRRRGHQLRTLLGVGEGGRIGLLAFGGMEYTLDLDRLPRLPGWTWLSALPMEPPARGDLVPWQRSGLGFSDLIASVDVVVTKPGYGTYSEAGLCGTAVLTVPRPDWPETAPFNAWLRRYTRCLEAPPEVLLSPALGDLLAELFRQPQPAPATASGVGEAADLVELAWAGETIAYACS